MLLLQVIATLLLAVASTGLSGLRLDVKDHTKRKSVDQRDNRPLPVRMDILDVQKDDVLWSLYIQALQRMQENSEDFFLSYYQLAGIHGRPYTSWNGYDEAPGAPTIGYCTHNSILFLPWHRPYLALFEQYLAAVAIDVANEYPDSNRATFQAAANRFRLPFWDWAAIPKLPELVSQPNITILTRNGYQKTNNPLCSYKFKKFPMDPALFPSDPNDPQAWDWWLAKYPNTVRGAFTPTSADNPGVVNYYLGVSNLMGQTYKAMVKPKLFNEFGTTATEGTSIEAVHNTVHGAVGGNFGHMSFLPYSAFDPIFWLHHTNVDRLFALWQAMNPDSYVQPQLDVYGNFAIPGNTMETVDTPLQPFSEDGNGPWWTSASARDIKTFEYTYPELTQSYMQSKEQLTANITAQVTKLYNPGRAFNRRRRTSARSKIAAQVTREWSAALSVSKFDLHGERFTIRLFLGAVPANVEDWATTNVGLFIVFPPPHSKTGPYPKLLTHSEVDLDAGLKEKGFAADDVSGGKRFLKRNLQWRIQKFDGSAVPTEELRSLCITVQDEIVTLASDVTERPTYGKKTLHPDITKGRAGGWNGSAGRDS